VIVVRPSDESGQWTVDFTGNRNAMALVGWAVIPALLRQQFQIPNSIVLEPLFQEMFTIFDVLLNR
jgi:hypothetical protein